MDPQSLVIIFRMTERILGVAIGGLLIYFGYRLFLDVRGRRGDGSGDFSVPGGTKIKLSKVGPGVFFAIFGAGLITFSIVRPVSLTTSGPIAPTKEKAGTTAALKFMGAASVPESGVEEVRRADAKKDIAALNRLVERSAATLTPQERVSLETAVEHAKLALMEPLWAEDWGDLADFREWLEKRASAPPGIAGAVDFFQQK